MRGQFWDYMQTVVNQGGAFLLWNAEDDETRKGCPLPAAQAVCEWLSYPAWGRGKWGWPSGEPLHIHTKATVQRRGGRPSLASLSLRYAAESRSRRTDLQPPQELSFAKPQEDANVFSSEELLHRLQDRSLGHQDQLGLIIEAEVVDFGPTQLGRLNAALRASSPITARATARTISWQLARRFGKCVATLQADEALAYAAHLLEAGSRTPVPLEVELELVKMIVRKLTANPPEPNDSLPELGDRLREIAKTYLNPRLLAREKYGTIALNATLGLILLRSRHVAEVLQIVSELKVPWFRQLLARRVMRLRHELKESSFESVEGLVGSLATQEAG